MKKKNCLFLIIIFSIAFISFAFCMCAFLYPNIRKEYPTISDFTSELNKYNCRVETNDVNEGINYIYKTTNDCDFDIELLVFLDPQIRNEYFNNYLRDVNDNGKIRGGETININVGTLLFGRDTNGDIYKSVLMKDNSILYVKTSLENRNQALQIKRNLGYKYEPNWQNIIYFIIPIISFSIGIVYVIIKSIKKTL